MARNGTILIIDDENGLSTKRLLDDSLSAVVRHPNDVTSSDLKRAKLILVDYKLTRWPDREDQLTPSLMPQDGIALIAVLKSNLNHADAVPTAFALNSGNLSFLSGGGEWVGREHMIARSIDLDWVFSKGGKRTNFPTAVKSLADAVASLPLRWPKSLKTKEKILSLLAVPEKARWRQSAVDAIERALPPHDILIENSAGMAVLRWLLHMILPFPTFLIDERYLAARLKVEPRSFSIFLKSARGKRFKRVLRSYEYQGVLRDFLGARWWRSGIEDWLWKGTKGRAFDHKAIQELVKKRATRSLKFTTLANPVVCLDDQLRPNDALIDIESAVEIKPDGWPSFADSAWIPRASASEPSFVAMVPQSEKDRL